MTVLVAAVVSAAVAALVTYVRERLTLDRRLDEAVARAEIQHDRAVILDLDRVIQQHREIYWASPRDPSDVAIFAVSLSADFRPLFRQLSNRMMRSMIEKDGLYFVAAGLAYDWSDAGASWGGDRPWWGVFLGDVQLVVEGIEELIGGAHNPYRD